jgi:V/A-type H+-transporting ATPase subunit D
MSSLDTIPTRAALLELQDERIVVNEAYEFLDEKRLLLAAEILRYLEMYERMSQEIQILGQDAHRHLVGTIGRHGLQGTTIYPPLDLAETNLKVDSSNFMGVTLNVTELEYDIAAEEANETACNPSSEAEDCRRSFLDLATHGAVLAGISGNLHRLLQAYRQTERRARALENVILPEIEQTLRLMSSHLEELDLEETVRARLQKKSPQGEPCGA